MSATLTLAEQLLTRASITPNDAGCQALIISRLEKIGFTCETLVSGSVTNLWAVRRGSAARAGKLLGFAGHTDVVPPGPPEAWISPPFTPTQRDGKLYARGAADMKTSLACFVVACEEFIAAHPQPSGSIAFLLTSDEEGPATDGTVKIIDALQARNEQLDYCIVGEPTSVTTLGDTIKNGRRGSLSGQLTIRGVQGHIAYPHLASNPIHLFAPALEELVKTNWDNGDEYFSPTAWQISNLNAGTGATNVTPATLVADFNFRFSPASTVESLKERMQAILTSHGLLPEKDYVINWTLNGSPFLTPRGTLSDALSRAIQDEIGVTSTLSTSGGTSDGRFIAKLCPQVIEFGPINASIHQINEHIALASIDPLKNIYRRVLEQLIA